MPGPYSELEAGRTIVDTSVNGQAVIATLDAEDEGPQESAYMRQPLGLRARPRNNKANAIVTQDGDYPEVLGAWDPGLGLPDIARGSTQLHSCGSAPQLIEVSDTEIKLGKDAAQHVVRGDAYRTAEDTFFDALQTLLSTAGASLVSAGTDAALIVVSKKAAASINAAGVALNTAVNAVKAFKANSSTYLSTLVKTE